MYLHLGSDCMVKNSEIIAIFNLRDPQSEIYKDYVEKYRDRYKIVDLSEGKESDSTIFNILEVIYNKEKDKIKYYEKDNNFPGHSLCFVHVFCMQQQFNGV